MAARRPTIKDNRERKGGKYFEEETILLPRKRKTKFSFSKSFPSFEENAKTENVLLVDEKKTENKKEENIRRRKIFFEEKEK